MELRPSCIQLVALDHNLSTRERRKKEMKLDGTWDDRITEEHITISFDRHGSSDSCLAEVRSKKLGSFHA